MGMRVSARIARLIIAVAISTTVVVARPPRRRHRRESATVTVNAGKAGCNVDIDGTPSGKTSSGGTIVLSDVAPSAHYIHVDCPAMPEVTVFVSPGAGESLEVQAKPSAADASSAPGAASPDNNLELRKLVTDASDDRSNGQFPAAVSDLRHAIRLDPSNPGLHHELGMTFLMIQDWPNAAVELREAIHDNPSIAGAHAGLGYALEKLGNLHAALIQYRLAVHLDPQDSSYEDHYVEVLGMLAAEKPQKKKRRF